MKYLVITVLLFTTACAGTTATVANTPQLSETARLEYNLKKVVDGIGTLQIAAENATTTNDSKTGKPLLSINSARIIVQFCVTANTTIGQVPNGWYSAVSAAYYTAKGQLSPDELIKFGVYLSAFEVVLTGVK